MDREELMMPSVWYSGIVHAENASFKLTYTWLFSRGSPTIKEIYKDQYRLRLGVL